MDAGQPGDAATAVDASRTPDAGVVTGCVGGPVEGCTARGTSGDFDCSLTVDGVERRFDLHAPSNWPQRPAAGVPLVFNFHGLNTTAALQRYFSGMDQAADARGFAVVTPEGIQMSWNAGVCCGGATAAGVDDVAFTLAILQRVSGALCVDSRRVFSTGLSNGGHMSYRLACEQSAVFAAIASVSGLEVVIPCAPQRPVPVLHFHGTSDTVVSYQVGIAGLGAEAIVQRWAQRNGCSAATTTVLQRGDVTCRQHLDCPQDTDVALCTISGGGHQWPGGESIPLLGHNTSDISATQHILDFFGAHPMP